MTNFEDSKVLKYISDNHIIDYSEVVKGIELMERKALLEKHNYAIWQNDRGEWFTYLPDIKKGRVQRQRRTREEIEDLIVEFYRVKIYIADVFKQWSVMKLEYGEIQKQTYDRYCTDFERFFKEDKPICRKQIRYITEEDLEHFVRMSIREHSLTAKGFSNLRTLIVGMFKYAKKRNMTTISISRFFGDLELPRTVFAKRYKPRENEVFIEDEIPVITDYLKNNVDIWNMGLLLQFQTGMRIGELCVLERSDIRPRSILVNKTEVKYKDDEGKWKVKVKQFAKTEAGNREIVIPKTAFWTLEMINQLNPNGEYLFMNNGKRIRENTFNKRLDTVCKRLGLNHRTTHKIRKTYGTTLLDSGVPDAMVAEQMGHSDIATTRRLYYLSNKTTATKIKELDRAIGF